MIFSFNMNLYLYNKLRSQILNIMTKIYVLFWQDIPTVIEARDSTGVEKVELSKRSGYMDHSKP